MIYDICGTLEYVEPAFAVIRCGGVGFKCFVSTNTVATLTSVGTQVTLFTHLSVKEDSFDLYGFATKEELETFRLLISVSGIGPKAAIAILSVLSPDRLAIAVSSGDSKAIQAAQGVGKKTAERVVLELKDKMQGVVSSEAATISQGINSISSSDNASEAVEVLVSLGFNQSDAAAVIGTMDKSLSVDDMIRKGLKSLSQI